MQKKITFFIRRIENSFCFKNTLVNVTGNTLSDGRKILILKSVFTISHAQKKKQLHAGALEMLSNIGQRCQEKWDRTLVFVPQSKVDLFVPHHHFCNVNILTGNGSAVALFIETWLSWMLSHLCDLTLMSACEEYNSVNSYKSMWKIQ